MWWYLFAVQWNGISLLWDGHTLLPKFNVHSDTSGSWGCGDYWGLHWFKFKWPDHLYALLVVVAAIFGHQWNSHLVSFSVDNLVHP